MLEKEIGPWRSWQRAAFGKQRPDQFGEVIVKLPDDIDDECLELSEAINLFDGVCTVESCCGHGRQQYCIWFEADNLRKMKPFLRVLNSHYSGWHCSVHMNYTFNNIYWELRYLGGMGQIAYDAAGRLAQNMRDYWGIL